MSASPSSVTEWSGPAGRAPQPRRSGGRLDCTALRLQLRVQPRERVVLPREHGGGGVGGRGGDRARLPRRRTRGTFGCQHPRQCAGRRRGQTSGQASSATAVLLLLAPPQALAAVRSESALRARREGEGTRRRAASVHTAHRPTRRPSAAALEAEVESEREVDGHHLAGEDEQEWSRHGGARCAWAAGVAPAPSFQLVVVCSLNAVADAASRVSADRAGAATLKTSTWTRSLTGDWLLARGLAQ
ncbi:hypothetical protein BS78_05G095100 [Paspalum vaginatum]|nr:hypothetical protein BS78_05G095100 [Paspalum vaginatum]